MGARSAQSRQKPANRIRGMPITKRVVVMMCNHGWRADPTIHSTNVNKPPNIGATIPATKQKIPAVVPVRILVRFDTCLIQTDLRPLA